jgi:hypothetical protein
MKLPSIQSQQRKASQRGALMAAALMMMVVTGIVMSAWVGLMAVRAQQVNFMEDALHRRQSLRNSKVIGRQIILQRAFGTGAAQTAVWDSLLAGPGGVNWGGVAMGAWNGNVFTQHADPVTSPTLFPFNPSGIMPDGGFVLTRRLAEGISMGNGQDEMDIFAFMKMANPALRGDLITVYRKPVGQVDLLDVWFDNTLAGHFANWRVEGRMVLRRPEDLFGSSTPNPLVIPGRCTNLVVPGDPENRSVVGTNLTGARVPPSGLAGVPMTGGSVPAGANQLWAGELNVVRNNSHPANSLWHKMEELRDADSGNFVTVDTANYSFGGSTPPLWVQRQIPNSPLRPPQPGETVGITYPTDATPLVTTAGGTWNVLFVQMDAPSLPNIRVTAGIGVSRIHQIVFRGQAPLSTAFTQAALLPPLLCLIVKNDGDQISPVQDIRFEHQNNRRWVLGVKGGTIADRLEMNWEGNWVTEGSRRMFNWRGVFVNEAREMFVNIKSAQNVRITGGVMTNWLFKRRRSASGFPRNETWDALTFALDANPEPAGASGAKYSSILPKDAWLETYVNLPLMGSMPVN